MLSNEPLEIILSKDLIKDNSMSVSQRITKS